MTLEWFDLNDRHIAVALWLLVFVVGLSFKTEVRRAIFGIVRIALERTILSALIGATVWLAIVLSATVVVGRMLGLWPTIPAVSGLYWFFISGIPLLFTSFTDDPTAYQKRLKEAFGIWAIFTAFISVSVFSLPVEVLIVFFAELLGILYVGSLVNEDAGEGVGKLFPIVPIVFYLAIVLGSLIGGKVDVVNALQSFMLPVILTAAFQPYIKYVKFMERYEGRGGPITRRSISSEDYGGRWPFTVERVRLCHQASSVWVETRRLFPVPSTKRYPVNGLAKPWLTRLGYECEDLEGIWKPASDGSKVNIGPIILDGLSLGEDSGSNRPGNAR